MLEQIYAPLPAALIKTKYIGNVVTCGEIAFEELTRCHAPCLGKIERRRPDPLHIRWKLDSNDMRLDHAPAIRRRERIPRNCSL